MNRYKKLFYLPNKHIYLSNHSTGCLPRKTKTVINHFMNNWAEFATDAWIMWLEELTAFEKALASLLDASADEFCLQTNVSSALVKIIGSLPKRQTRNKILISDEDFSSIRYVMQQAERLGYDIEVVASMNGRFTVEQWIHKIDETVQMIFLTHVLPKNNFRLSVEDIIHYANQYDVYSVVDIAQSVGVIPVSARKLNSHFIIGNCLKWLCGGPISAFMWVNKQSLELFQPIDVGWFSKEDPFEKDVNHFKYANNARRFLGGTPAIIPCVIARSGIETINDIGIEIIYQHSQTLCAPLIDYVNNRKLNIQSPLYPSERGGTVCLKFKNPLPVFHHLHRHGFITDSIKIMHDHSNIRISPHIYNDMDEINQLITCLETIDDRFT